MSRSFEGGGDPLRVANIAGDHLDLAGDVVEPSPAAIRVVVDECTDLGPLRQERFDEMTADEPLCSGDDDAPSRLIELMC